MNIAELIEKHAECYGPAQVRRYTQFAVELLEGLLTAGQIEQGNPFIDVKLTMQAIDEALEELRK